MGDFDLDAYYAFVNQMADECVSKDLSPQDLLEKRTDEHDERTLKAIRLRESLSDGADLQRVEGLLVTGLFRQLRQRDRIGTLLICFDLGGCVEQRRLEARFARYKAEDPLFQYQPSLLERVRDGELVPRDAFNEIGEDGVVEIRGGYSRLDPMLAPAIVHTLADAYPTATLYVRLDPEQASAHRPKRLLLESILVPANPRWWRNLGLFRGQETGAQYSVIAPANAADDLPSFVEYHVQGLRKLETIAQRKEVDHLTMMLEELELLRNGLLIGRCIHLDTRAPQGTSPAEAKVLHVDLAINVYAGQKVGERLKAQMNDAEKVKATFRTHLLRTESIPFDVLTLLSFMFFRSHLLRQDLFVNQFSV